MSDKKPKKATVSEEIPVRQPARPPVNIETTNYASAGTASDPNIAGPGVQHPWQDTAGNGGGSQAFNTLSGPNPTFGQLPNIHHTGGFNPHFQQGPASQLPQAGCFYPNNNSVPHLGAFQLHQHNPSWTTNCHPNLVSYTLAFQPSLHHHLVRTIFIPISTNCCHCIPNMADYGNGAMPNTGQHFQPPVPDTTYGPMTHVYRPRFDGGVQVAAVGGQMFSSFQSVPCACPYPTAPAPIPISMPQVQTGIATAPMAMPMMSHQPQPFMMPGVPPMQAMPAMVSSQGIPAVMSTPGIPQPVGGMMGGGCQPQVVTGNCPPDMLPPGMLPPDIMGIGRTQGENTSDLLDSMHKDNVLEPQDIKPADDDPARMYLCRELDGNWTKRSRFTIDRLPCRWYITPWGGFYAVRLED